MICCDDSRLDWQQLEAPASARAVRAYEGPAGVVDGAFTETTEYLGGFNPIAAADLDRKVHIASSFPRSRTGVAETHSVRDIKLVPHQTGV